MSDLISRQAAIDALRTCYDTETISMDNGDEYINYGDAVGEIEHLPSAQTEEVTPHRNYKYLSDYWCTCGWHLGKKGEVKYCADCGRKVNWGE